MGEKFWLRSVLADEISDEMWGYGGCGDWQDIDREVILAAIKGQSRSNGEAGAQLA